jgi:protein MpaA
MKTFIFGHSHSGLPIWGHRFGFEGKRILIIGGVHGNEPEGVVAAESLLERFYENYGFRLSITVVPALNIDGVLKGTRKNARAVDLNRNLPTKDWTSVVAEDKYHPGPSPLSETENKALVQFIETEKPEFILSLHSFSNPMLLDNESLCTKECQVMSSLTGYVIKNQIGYPTPGSLGTYGAVERSIPTLTYELLRGMDFTEIKNVHVPAIYEMLNQKQN